MSSAPTKNCIHCGYEIALGAITCPYCRGGQTPGASPPRFPRVKVASRYVYEERPAGVTALAVLLIFIGLGTLALVPFVQTVAKAYVPPADVDPEELAQVQALTVVLFVAGGVIQIAVGVGLLLLRQWARIAGIVLAGASAVGGMVRVVTDPEAFDGYVMFAVGIVIGIYLIAVGPYFGRRAVQYVAKAPRR